MLSSGRTFSLAGEVVQVGMEVLIAVSVMRAHLRTYPAEFYYSVQSGNETTQKSNANYVTTLAENGPAIAGHSRTSRTGSGAYTLACMQPRAHKNG